VRLKCAGRAEADRHDALFHARLGLEPEQVADDVVKGIEESVS